MNVIIVHGTQFKKDTPFTPDKQPWMLWIKNKLEEKNVKTFIPLMPNFDNPKYEEWKKEFERLDVNENTIFIGHSAGGAFLVRWLGETSIKIKKLILVMPGKIAWGAEDIVLKKFYDFKIELNVKNCVNGRIVIFSSDNDAEWRLRSIPIYKKELNARVIELKGRGHFIEKHMGTKEFPELLDEVLS